MSKNRKQRRPTIRLDQALVRASLAEDVDEAKRLIMAGQVVVGDHRLDKAGALVPVDAALRVKGRDRRFVSRAGHKLEGALAHFQLDVAGLIALDLGASTGGFTDCLLQQGAAKVYAVDVGTNQLDYRLRIDPRVVSLEKTHARDLNAQLIPEPIDLLVVDVSFTSLTYVLPSTLPLLKPGARAVCLFKPQFELPREQVGPGGVVTDLAAVSRAMTAMETWFGDNGLVVQNHMESTTPGREGNREHLYLLTRTGPLDGSAS